MTLIGNGNGELFFYKKCIMMFVLYFFVVTVPNYLKLRLSTPDMSTVVCKPAVHEVRPSKHDEAKSLSVFIG